MLACSEYTRVLRRPLPIGDVCRHSTHCNAFTERHLSLGLEAVGTVCTLVMDLGARELHVTRGNPIHNDFEKVTFTST